MLPRYTVFWLIASLVVTFGLSAAEPQYTINTTVNRECDRKPRVINVYVYYQYNHIFKGKKGVDEAELHSTSPDALTKIAASKAMYYVPGTYHT